MEKLADGCPKFVTKEDLLQPEKGLLSNDTLALFCEVRFAINESINVFVPVPKDPIDLNPEKDIEKSVEGMAINWTNEKHSLFNLIWFK